MMLSCALRRHTCGDVYEAQLFVKAEVYLLPSQSLEMAANIQCFREAQVFVRVPIRQGQFSHFTAFFMTRAFTKYSTSSSEETEPYQAAPAAPEMTWLAFTYVLNTTHNFRIRYDCSPYTGTITKGSSSFKKYLHTNYSPSYTGTACSVNLFLFWLSFSRS